MSGPNEADEKDIILRAAQGDREAFSVLYERYVRRIYSYIYYRTGNVHDAEDLTERVFHRALHHIRNFRYQGLPFSAWLYRIAHNLVANWHRDNQRRQEVPIEGHLHLVMRGEHPESHLERNQEIERLIQAIQKLSPERQNLIVLKFVEQLSNEEIGKIMGRSEGAIKSLYHRTLISLRNELGIDLEEEQDQ